MSIRCRRLDTATELPRAAWDALVPTKAVVLERAHLEALERAQLNHLGLRYLALERGDRLVGAAHLFVIELDMTGIGTAVSPRVANIIRSWMPGFMHLRVVECGLLAGLGEGIAADEEAWPEVLPVVAGEIAALGREHGCDVALIRDIPPAQLPRYRALLERGWQAVPGFPSAVLEMRWPSFEAYLAALKSSRRRSVREHQRALADAELRIETLHEVEPHAERLAELWHAVHRRATSYQHEVLSARYFAEMKRRLGSRAEFTVARRGEDLVAFSLDLCGDETWTGLYYGVADEARSSAVYFNLHYHAIARAAELGLRRVDFGITSYDFELAIGCDLAPCTYLVRHLAQSSYSRAFADELRRGIVQPRQRHRPFKEQPARSRVETRPLHKAAEAQDAFGRTRAYTRANAMRMAELHSFFVPFHGAQQAEVPLEGRPVIMLGSNAYLGLATHPEVQAAAQRAIAEYGTGCSGSPLLNGTLDLHETLAEALARFLRKERAMLFSSGYQANLGAVSALVNWNDVVLMDAASHASLVDGAVLARARVQLYAHNDLRALEQALASHRGRNVLIVSDSLFSMEGTVADVAGLIRVARQHGARLLLDEAHAVGLMGPGGRGVAEQQGVLPDVDLVVGTFSKCFASVGGFVAGPADIIDAMRHTARSHVFSASLPPAAVAAVLAALEIIEREPERRQRALHNASELARGLRQLGYDAVETGTAIVPVRCGDELLTLAFTKKLLDEGVYVNPVLHPAVAKGAEQLRTSVMATHGPEHLQRALQAFARCRIEGFP